MKRRAGILWVIVGLAALLAGCGSQDGSATIEASGFLEARTYRVVSLAQAQVESVDVGAGDEVDLGQVLVTLDLTALEAQRQAAAAGLTQAEAALDRLERAPTEAEVDALQAALDAAQVDLQSSETTLEQLEDAYSGGQPPDRLRIPAQSAVDAAQATVDLAQARLDQAQAGARAEELRAAQAAVDAAQATLEMAELQLELAQGTAPVDGVVQQVGPRADEWVSQGSLLATVADTRQLYVIVYLGQEQVARIQPGDTTEVRVDAYPDQVFDGEVTWIADQAQFTPTTVQTMQERVSLVYAVRIEVDNTDGSLIAGLPADVMILP